jgi:phospholipid/cholesterol/gamma-HCH transport system permease protein
MIFLDALEGFGKYIRMLGSLFAKPEKISMYWRETMRQMYDIGVGSFWIIAIVGLFIGGVTAVQFVNKLLTFGGFVPMWWMGSMTRDSMILELAPTISALLLSGKIGSNIATELGTMRITEQIDAMDIMGVNTHAFLLGPKIVGAIIIVPMLIITAMLMGTAGGALAGVLGDYYSIEEYTFGLQDDFQPIFVRLMFIKSIVFPFLITTIACYKGFYVKGGSIEIGKASTDAVVYSSIAVVIANFLIAFIFL